MIEIDQRNAPDRRPRQRLGRPRTDTTDANHAHVRLAQGLQPGRTIQFADAAEKRRSKSKSFMGPNYIGLQFHTQRLLNRRFTMETNPPFQTYGRTRSLLAPRSR